MAGNDKPALLRFRKELAIKYLSLKPIEFSFVGNMKEVEIGDLIEYMIDEEKT